MNTIELPVELHDTFSASMQDALNLAKNKGEVCVVVLFGDGFRVGTEYQYSFDDWEIVGRCYPGGRAMALCLFEDRDKP